MRHSETPKRQVLSPVCKGSIPREAIQAAVRAVVARRRYVRIPAHKRGGVEVRAHIRKLSYG